MKQEDVDKLLSEKIEDGEHISPILPQGIKKFMSQADTDYIDALKLQQLQSVKTGGKRMFRQEWIDQWIKG